MPGSYLLCEAGGVVQIRLLVFLGTRIFFAFLCLSFCKGYLVLADQSLYLYDDQERLIGVADSAGATAIYTYDPVGNLLSIDRFSPPGSGIGIYIVNPIMGPVAQLCQLQGYGFDRWADRKEAGSLR